MSTSQITRTIIWLSAAIITITCSASVATAADDDHHIYAGVFYDANSSMSRCEWSLPIPSSGATGLTGATTREWNGNTWTLYVCTIADTQRFVWVPDIRTETIAESSRDFVRGLVPTLLNNFSPPPQRGVVKTPTWFWVQPLLWRPVSVTAYLPTPRGVLTMTTTATPESLEFHPGDGSGEVAECDGPGLPWSPILPSFIRSDCVYDYPIPSSRREGGTFRARLDVVWSVTWRTNLGASGQLPDLRLGSSHNIRVRELQAVASR